LLLIVLIYGIAAGMRHRRAAEMLVDNWRLSEELSSSLAHAEFLALHDPLTGQYNRRAFFQRAAAASAARDRHVLTIDLDHFKAINDRHGHAAGDTVLVGVGQALRAVLGELDPGEHFSARLGGEEFVMVIDVANPELAGAVAEMTRHAIGLIGPSGALRPLVTSASIGLCRWAPGETIDDVLSRADAALFQAKARGRDRVMAAAA
jgi:diguanylate cyclase (GGDEF)-like protein